jgi:AcrR family transcriptional regulator
MARSIRNPESRERIVDAAATVVAAQGLQGATMRAIATEAGVSTGFITHYFEDKQALMVEVLRRTNARAARRVLRASKAGPGIERLRAALEAVLPLDVARRREWQVWVAVWSQAAPGEELAAGYRAGWIGLRSIFAGLIEQACAEDALEQPLDVDYHAERLVTVLAGVGLLAGVERPGRVRAVARRMLDDELGRLGAELVQSA